MYPSSDVISEIVSRKRDGRSTHGRCGMRIELWSENLKGRDNL
jgi:hypothetical protein